MPRDLTGQTFGSWIAVRLAETKRYANKTHVPMWLCLCMCGALGRVFAITRSLGL